MERRQNQIDAHDVPNERPQRTPDPDNPENPENPGEDYPDENPEPRKTPEPSRQWE